jgi:hypothetical protein
MNYKTIVITMTIAAALFCTTNVNAQEQSQMARSEHHDQDSVEMASLHEAQAEKIKDDNRMADAKLDRKQTRAKAKNAQRIENDADDAARESKYAVRAERRAQKSRRQANKQADKALKARAKSDQN